MAVVRLFAGWVIIALAIPLCLIGAIGMLVCEIAKDVRGYRQ